MPGQKSCWIHEMSFAEVEEYLSRNDIALVPFGATEQHGLHAPLMLDTAWAISAAEGAAERTGVLVAPPVHYGWSHAHMGFAGTITLRAETFTSIAIDICESLIYHGFRKVILVNGNRMVLQPLDIAAVKVRNRTGAFIAIADCGLIAKNEIKATCESDAGALGHAGEAETSMILATFPQFVDMGHAVDGSLAVARTQTSALARGHTQLDPEEVRNTIYYPTLGEELRATTKDTHGVRGAADKATAAKGGRMIEAMVANIAGFIEEIRPLKVQIKEIDVPS